MQNNIYKTIVMYIVSLVLTVLMYAAIFSGITSSGNFEKITIFLFIFSGCNRFVKFIFPKD